MSEAAVGTAPAAVSGAGEEQALRQTPVRSQTDKGVEAGGEPRTREEKGTGEKPPRQERKGETPQARRARYEALVRGKGEFADLFREDTQRAVQGRLAQAQKALETQRPVMDLLMSRYGAQSVDQLQQALEKDALWWRSYAQAWGITEEQARSHLRLRSELEAARRQSARQEGGRRAEAQMRLWAREAQELQKRYPDFDIQRAMEDETFRGLLRSRVPMQAAYEVANMEGIKRSVAARAAREAEAKITATIQANGARPVEGGASGAPGSSIKPDPSRMSETEVLELMERARRGEKIIF